MEEYYSVEQAAEKAIKWCQQHPGWQRICDIEDTDRLYKTWEELPQRMRKKWENEYRSDAEMMWKEFGTAICKVPYGHVSGKGIFYKNVLDVPDFHNSMMVFKTDEPSTKNHS